MERDLNLLRPLAALLSERNVSRAAERCSIGQPAMSRILERLRTLFGDELLVRNGRRYERTARGEELLSELQTLLPQIDAAINREPFAIGRYSGRFRISATDYACVVLIPGLLSRARYAAPSASLDITLWDPNAFAEDLFLGRSDAAIMPIEVVPADLRVEHLFNDRFVCMVAAEHSLPDATLDLETYLSFPHAVIDVVQGMQPRIDRSLAVRGVQRRVAYRTPFLASAVLGFAKTELILTLPRRLAASLIPLADLRIIAAPAELEPFDYALVSHHRLDASPANRWLREQIRITAQTLPN